MSDESEKQACHHRSFTVKHDQMEAGEQHLYAECDVCGQKKSALVDWPRNEAYCGPVGDGEWATELKDMMDELTDDG